MYLNCKTYYSFRYGTYATEELVHAAQQVGATGLALTNINSTSDAWPFISLCKKAGIKPIVGTEVRNEDDLLYILLAANNRGLAAIQAFLSVHLINKELFPTSGENTSFFSHPEDGFVIYPLGAKSLDKLSCNERIGVLPWEVNKLFGLEYRLHADKLVIRQPVTFPNKTGYNLHRLLRAIDKNTLLSKLSPTTQADPRETFVPGAQLFEAFKQYPTIITNTYRLIDACHVELDDTRDKTKQTFSASKEDDRVLLEKLAWDGFLRRYHKNDKAAKERLEKELRIINSLGFNAYFLINNDIVNYARMRGFYHVGRGSGANSIVAYCLGITDVDPIELNLYFERFLNPERTSPPDFDIDFSHKDRDEIFDYIFKRFGRDHVALCGSYTTFKGDSVIRELGKVFGLCDKEIKALQRSGQPQDDIQRLIIQYGRRLLNFPNIQSIHPCGVLISEKKITEYTTLFLPPKGFAASQIDMFTAEDIGLNKFDILSQRGLSHIKECESIILQNRGIAVNIHDFDRFMQDESVKAQIREAKTIGCFYIESPAMRQLLKKLRCDDYKTLVAASSIIRPGVAQSGMMREYIYRYHNRDSFSYIHPLFKEHLSETFGVMVFQEDVIKIAHYFAGLSLGEADVLRRAMSGKYRDHNRFSLMQENYLKGCEKMGHTKQLAEEVWRQMVSFAGYSFNKAHSASFAKESYMSLFLKTYYPLEFLVAVINNFGGFYKTEVYFFELLKGGATILPPCVNKSGERTAITGTTVYVGFIHIKGLQDNLVERILEERKRGGAYLHLQDFVERIHPGLEQLNKLISVGAFSFTGKSKKRLLWEANFLQQHHQAALPGAPVLFGDEPLNFILPHLVDDPVDDLYDQLELLEFTLSNPFELVADNDKYVTAKELPQYIGKTVRCLTYFISRKHVITKSNDEMFFGTFMDQRLNWIDTVHFPDVVRRYPLHSSGFYRISGKVVSDFGVCSIEISKMEKVGYKSRTYSING